jgi:predicted transcriptional regulator
MGSEELARFLFEIASDERLAILEAIRERPLKHAEIARLLSMTGSETTRHLNRLASAGLVAKNGRGAYEATQVSAALRAGLPFLRFLTGHRAFVLTHNLLVLETPFLERLGELEAGTFTNGTYHVVAVQENALRATRRRIWVVTEQRFEQALPILRERAGAGADVRIVRPRPAIVAEARTEPRVERNFLLRVIPEVPLFLAVLDDQAGVCFPSLDGRVDLTMMLRLEDPAGVRWSEDLFRSIWERADEWHGYRTPTPAHPGAVRS